MKTIWTEITKEEYMERVQGLRPLQSFSDPDGISPIGYGKPAMDTIWGKEIDFPEVKCEMRKESRHDNQWNYRYYGTYSQQIQELIQ